MRILRVVPVRRGAVILVTVDGDMALLVLRAVRVGAESPSAGWRGVAAAMHAECGQEADIDNCTEGRGRSDGIEIVAVPSEVVE